MRAWRRQFVAIVWAVWHRISAVSFRQSALANIGTKKWEIGRKTPHEQLQEFFQVKGYLPTRNPPTLNNFLRTLTLIHNTIWILLFFSVYPYLSLRRTMKIQLVTLIYEREHVCNCLSRWLQIIVELDSLVYCPPPPFTHTRSGTGTQRHERINYSLMWIHLFWQTTLTSTNC